MTGATNDIFKMLNNADLTFGTVVDEDGDTVNLTHGNYITFMESHDRDLRKAAFTNMYEAYKAHINTIATTYNYNVKNDVVSARIRKYDSARQAALSAGNIPEEVYDNLIAVVHEYLPILAPLYRAAQKSARCGGTQNVRRVRSAGGTAKKDIPYQEALRMMQEGLGATG